MSFLLQVIQQAGQVWFPDSAYHIEFLVTGDTTGWTSLVPRFCIPYWVTCYRWYNRLDKSGSQILLTILSFLLQVIQQAGQVWFPDSAYHIEFLVTGDTTVWTSLVPRFCLPYWVSCYRWYNRLDKSGSLILLTILSFLLQVIQQAGQVWFPDSAYKTSQAIKDFNREELPLMVFANWRGFSGGMKGTRLWHMSLVASKLSLGFPAKRVSNQSPQHIDYLEKGNFTRKQVKIWYFPVSE